MAGYDVDYSLFHSALGEEGFNFGCEIFDADSLSGCVSGIHSRWADGHRFVGTNLSSERRAAKGGGRCQGGGAGGNAAVWSCLDCSIMVVIPTPG